MGPFPNKGEGTHNPVIQSGRWPWAHYAVRLQNQGAVADGYYGAYASGDGYSTFLLRPPAAAYNIRTLIPIEVYEAFLRASWWGSEFRKYGMQGLRVTSTPVINSLEASTTGRGSGGTLRRGLQNAHIPTHVTLSILDGPADLAQLFASTFPPAAQRFLTNTLTAVQRRGHHVLRTALLERLLDVVTPMLEDQRLQAEQLTWPRTYDEEITGIANTTADDFRTIEAELQALGAATVVDRPHMLISDLNIQLDDFLQNGLLELHRR